MSIVSLWVVTGLFVDGWAHTHGRVDETFFTPYHAILYSSLAAATLVLGFAAFINYRKGISWRYALPSVYRSAALGIPLFFLAGIFDLIWHEIFGTEVDVEALLSPSHLVLAFSGWLIVSSPFREAWSDESVPYGRSPRAIFSLFISVIAMLSVLTFFLQFVHPIPTFYFFSGRGPAPETLGWWALQELGIVSILLNSALIAGFVFFIMKRWRLPLGSYTSILAINGFAMGFVSDTGISIQYLATMAVIAYAGAGLIIDILVFAVSGKQANQIPRVFAFSVPAVISASVLGTFAIIEGLWWSIHLWLGVIFMSGIGGIFLHKLSSGKENA